MILQLLISIAAFVATCLIIIRFWANFKRYKYVGNRYVYLCSAVVVCLCLSFYINFSNEYANPIIPVFSSFFDAARMAVLSFDASKFEIFKDRSFINYFFIGQYVFTSATTFVFLSLTLVLSFLRTFGNSITSWFRKLGKSAKIYYIFTDSKVTVSLKLAQELLQKKPGQRGNAVTVYVSTASLKTQEGTEFRDMIVGNKIHVRAEAFSDKLAKKFVKKYFKKNATKEVVIYCMFSNNETASMLSNNFQNALFENEVFQELNGKLQAQFNIYNTTYNYSDVSFEGIDKSPLEKFKIFVTYHNTDIDVIYNYSKNSLHVINTLSQYDMISSKFLFDYPISKFLDFKSAINEEDINSMNVTFFGFGSVNKPIFEKMTYAYQLWGDNVHKVHYHIVDRNSNSIVESISNEYTTKSDKPYHPFLYDIDADLDGKDLKEYEIIDKYVKKLISKKNRFETQGFEQFIISMGNTNDDLMCAINLRNALVKYVDADKLAKTYIFVRRSEGELYPHDFVKGPVNHIFDNGYDFSKNHLVPIITYGGNALMPIYIKDYYNDIIATGIQCEYAYCLCQKSNIGCDEKALKTKIEYCWLDKSKKAVLKNTRSVYSLEPKKELIKLASEEQIKNMEDPSVYETYDLSNPIVKLANLEHNRWMAANYMIAKSRPMDIETYLKGKPDKTKSNEQTVHVCMITNEGLRVLYSSISDREFAYGTFYQVDVKTAALMLKDENSK